jgi:hypothetical protein
MAQTQESKETLAKLGALLTNVVLLKDDSNSDAFHFVRIECNFSCSHSRFSSALMRLGRRHLPILTCGSVKRCTSSTWTTFTAAKTTSGRTRRWRSCR